MSEQYMWKRYLQFIVGYHCRRTRSDTDSRLDCKRLHDRQRIVEEVILGNILQLLR